MTYQIDQSIRIEETNRDTVIGLADTKTKNSFALVIPAKTKRRIQEYYRRQNLPKIFMIDLFTAGIILVLKKLHFKMNNLVIDIEYPGHEIRIIRQVQSVYPHISSVSFSIIGKHSPAHYAAYGVHIHKRKPEYRANYRELISLVNKKDRGL